MEKNAGKIIISPDVNVWAHEIKTAQALAAAGYDVTFIRCSNRDRDHSADAVIGKEVWEFKSPKSDKLDAVERNLKKAVRQSHNVVFDSRRMKRIPDTAILRELTTKSLANKALKRVMFVNRHGIIVVVK